MGTEVKLSKEFTIIYGGEVIAYATDFTLENNKEVVDITKLGDEWKNKKVTLKDFSVTFNGMVTRGDTITAYLWNPVTVYSAGDHVVIAGNSYVAQGSTTGDNPTTDDGTNWIETSDYASVTTYDAGDMVYYQDVPDEKRIYISLVGSNTGNNPPDSPTQWERLTTNYESLIDELKNNDTEVKCTLKPSGSGEIYFVGNGVLTNAAASFAVADKATYSGSFAGSGPLSKGVSGEPAVLFDGNTEGWYEALLAYMTLNGAVIVNWADRSGKGNDLNQAAIPSAQPEWNVDGVIFNGLTQYIKAAFPYGQPEFIYLVFKQITWTLNSYVMEGHTTGSGKLQQRTVTPNLIVDADISSSENANLPLDTWGIARILFNGASSKFIIDDTTPITGDFGNDDMDGICFGASPGGSLPANIQVKEGIARSIADSSEDEAAIFNYLKNKYSL